MLSLYRIAISPNVSPLLWGRIYTPRQKITPKRNFWRPAEIHFWTWTWTLKQPMDDAYLEPVSPEIEAALGYYVDDRTRLAGLGVASKALLRSAEEAERIIVHKLDYERRAAVRMAQRRKPGYTPPYPTILLYRDLDEFLGQLPVKLEAPKEERIRSAWREALASAEALTQAETALFSSRA